MDHKAVASDRGPVGSWLERISRAFFHHNEVTLPNTKPKKESVGTSEKSFWIYSRSNSFLRQTLDCICIFLIPGITIKLNLQLPPRPVGFQELHLTLYLKGELVRVEIISGPVAFCVLDLLSEVFDTNSLSGKVKRGFFHILLRLMIATCVAQAGASPLSKTERASRSPSTRLSVAKYTEQASRSKGWAEICVRNSGRGTWWAYSGSADRFTEFSGGPS